MPAGYDHVHAQLTGTRVRGEDFAKPGQNFTAYYDASEHSVDTAVSGEDLSFDLVVIGWLLVLAFVQFWFRIMIPRQRRRMHRLQHLLDDLGRRQR
jgi:hypothetical protein